MNEEVLEEGGHDGVGKPFLFSKLPFISVKQKPHKGKTSREEYVLGTIHADNYLESF